MKYSKILSLLLCSFLLVNLVSSANKVNNKIVSKGTYTTPTKSTTNLAQKAKVSGDDNTVNQSINLDTTNSGTTSETVSQDTQITGNNNQVTKDVKIDDTNKDGAAVSTNQDSSTTGDSNQVSQSLNAAQRTNDNSKVDVSQEIVNQGDNNQQSQTVNDQETNKDSTSTINQTSDLSGNNNVITQKVQDSDSISGNASDSSVQLLHGTGENNNMGQETRTATTKSNGSTVNTDLEITLNNANGAQFPQIMAMQGQNFNDGETHNFPLDETFGDGRRLLRAH